MKNILLLSALIVLSYSCKPNASQKENANTQEPQSSTQVSTTLPSIPEALLTKVFMECDFVDYIFYELPFSMSYDQQSTIQSVLRWVDGSTKIPSQGCKALGRMIFQSKGDIMIEAEIYVSQECAYYKWFVDGTATYNNLMTMEGINHYAGIIQQFEKKQ